MLTTEHDKQKPGKFYKANRKRKKRQHSGIFVVLCGTLCAIIVLSFFLLLRNDGLKGKWEVDSSTVYAFDGRGHGSLLLPEHTFLFRYEIRENEISFDFESESARDMVYRYQKNGNELTLEVHSSSESAQFQLKKVR